MFYVMSKDLEGRVVCTTEPDEETAEERAEFLLSREYVVTVALVPSNGTVVQVDPEGTLDRLENEELS